VRYTVIMKSLKWARAILRLALYTSFIYTLVANDWKALTWLSIGTVLGLFLVGLNEVIKEME